MEDGNYRNYADPDQGSQMDSIGSSLERGDSLESVALSVLSPVPEEPVSRLPTHFDTKMSWIILLCGYTMQIIVMGLMHTYGIFYVAFLEEFDKGEAMTAVIGSAAYGLNMLTGSVVGVLQGRLQTRYIMILGCSLSALSCFLSSFVTSFELMFFTFSFLFGIGSSMCYTPTICLPQVYFLKHISLATGIMMAGSSSGTLLMSPLVNALIDSVGWRMTLRIFAILCLCCIPLMAIIAPPKVEISLRHCESRKMLSELKIWKNRVFILWASAVTLAMFAYNTPGVHIIALGTDRGIPAEQGAYFLIAFGLCASVGRVVWGRLLQAELLNWTNAHQCAMIMTGTAHTFLPSLNSFTAIMVYVIIVGLLDGGYTVLLPLLTSQFLGSDKAPMVWGFVISSASVSFMLGPMVSGILRAETGKYDLAFHVIGLSMILAGLIEFLIPWAQRTANPEKTLISMFSEIYPGSNIEDIEAFSDGEDDEEAEIYSVLEAQLRRKEHCRSIASRLSTGRRSKVSFGGVTSPRQQSSKASQYSQCAAPTTERTTRRRCYSESVEMCEVATPNQAKSSQAVGTPEPVAASPSTSAENLVSDPKPQVDSAVSRTTWDPTHAISLDTVHENEILKITSELSNEGG